MRCISSGAVGGLTFVLSLTAAPALAQPEPDAAAAKAFADLVQSNRDRAGLTIRNEMKLEVGDGKASSQPREVKAEFTYAKGGSALLKLNGFTCTVHEQVLTVIHESTKDKYFYTEQIEGSAYWHFLDIFREMPFPHLGLLWGDEAASDVWMELHPRTSEIAPTSLVNGQDGEHAVQTIVFTGEGAQLRLHVDPETRLVRSMEHQITAGPMVETGAKIVSRYKFDYDILDKAPDATVFKIDTTKLQRVSMVSELIDRPPAAAAAAAPGEPGGMPAPQLVGQPAPPFILATSNGDAIDLADLRGQVVVLDFWATWCPPCRVGLPLLHEVAKWAADSNLPVKVIPINTLEIQDPARNSPDARLASMTKFWTEKKFTLNVAMDYSDQTAMAYGVTGIPTGVIIRADGVIHSLHVGLHGGPEQYVALMKEEIRAALDALEVKE